MRPLPCHHRRWTRALPLLGALGVAVVALALGSCTSSIGRCYAEDVTFLPEADEESVIEISLADCLSGHLFAEDTEIAVLELPLLESVGGSLVLSFNVALERVELPRLREVGGVLEVTQNPLLEVLSLPALEHVGGALVVSGNGALDEAAVEQALAEVEVDGATTIRP